MIETDVNEEMGMSAPGTGKSTTPVADEGESTTSNETTYDEHLEQFAKLVNPAVLAQAEQAIRMAERPVKLNSESPFKMEGTRASEASEDLDRATSEKATPDDNQDDFEAKVLDKRRDLVADKVFCRPELNDEEDETPPTEEKEDELPPSEEKNEFEVPGIEKVKSHDPIESVRSVDPVDEWTKDPPITVALGEWSSVSKEVFSLQHAPPTLAIPQVEKICDARNDTLWKRYYDSRCLLKQACQKEDEAEEKTLAHVYRKEIQIALQDTWQGSKVDTYLGPHTYIRTTNVKKDQDGELEDATVVSTIFSPFFLPRAIQLCMRYHRRLEEDFWCSWHIQFISLKDKMDDNMQYWRPHLTDMWEVCSNGYAQMPTAEVGFMPVEEIDTSFLTPNMIRKIRKWLFGSLKSIIIADDLTLIKYLLGTTGVINDFELLHGDIGYTWIARDAQEEDMIDFDVDDEQVEHATVTGTNWLEFQCRMITGSLRSIDSWYDPYDLKYHKGKWGEAALEHRFKTYGIRFKNAHVRNSPHKVWDLALRGIMHDTPASSKPDTK